MPRIGRRGSDPIWAVSPVPRLGDAEAGNIEDKVNLGHQPDLRGKMKNLTIELPRGPEAPALARRALEDLKGELDPMLLPDMKLLVSELISNSVKYGGEGPVRLEVTSAPDRVRADITDHGGGFTPVPRDDNLDKLGGWGLHLVEHLADDWGTGDGSAHVWFEIDPRRRGSRAA